MIITQTPLRISLAGGGTDLPGFYRQHGGAVVSSAIDKYIYVIIKARFDKKIRVGYTRTEMVDSIDQIEHELVRECMRFTGVDYGVEIATMADIPSEGSGLGSSSTVTVGLLNALYAYKGELVTAERLASEACHIEIDILGKPIGKQDQYIAAYGGFKTLEFATDETVRVSSPEIPEETIRALGESLLLFYTGTTRSSNKILAAQSANISSTQDSLISMKEQVEEIKDALLDGDLNSIGSMLDAGWRLKRELAPGISNPEIDRYYDAAIRSGALGGKIAGAGGGGFLLFLCPPAKQADVRESLKGLQELRISLERDGTKVIFNNRRQ